MEVIPAYFCLWGACPPTLVHVPLFVSVRPMGDANGTYLSAGISLWRAFGDPHNGERVDGFLHLKGGEGAVGATFEAGYEWRVIHQSLVVRPTADLLVGPDRITPLVGVALGVAL